MNAAVRVLIWWFFAPQNTTNKTKKVKQDPVTGIPMWLQRTSAFLILLCASPIVLLTMLLIVLESKGGLFYSQTRVGLYGKRFNCLKLRSMYVKDDYRYVEPVLESSDREGICKKYVNDPRITKVGKFIRKYSIDELPQLMNVVKGDMALIGPRPSLICEFEQYDSRVYSRLLCEAGITGLWQVSGRANTTFEEQVMLDQHYVNNQSVWLDIAIILRTIPAVLFAKGAY